MSLLYMNGWDYLPNNIPNADADLSAFCSADGYYGNLQFVATVPGAFGGNSSAFRVGNSTEPRASIKKQAPNGCVFGARVKFGGASVQSQWYIYDSIAGVKAVNISVDGTGRITASVIKSDGSYFIYNTIAATVLRSTWFYLQFKYIEGFFEVKVNGEIVISATNAAIHPHVFDSIGIYGDGDGTSSDKTYIDDCYILDPTIGDTNIDYLGNILVPCNIPIANGSHISLTPVGVSENWEAGADWRLNSGTYDFTTTVGDYDLYQMQAGAASRQIFGIQLKGAFTQDNGIQLYGKNQMKVGSTLYPGTQKGLNSLNYGTIDDYFDKNPATGVSWVTADLADMECGPLLAASD